MSCPAQFISNSLHIALSLVVLLAVMKGKGVYLLLAILLHALANFPAGNDFGQSN